MAAKRLQDLVEHLPYRVLDHLVLQRRDSPWPSPPIGFRYPDSPRRLRSIGSAMDSPMPFGQPILQVSLAMSSRPLRAPPVSSDCRGCPVAGLCSHGVTVPVNFCLPSFLAASRTRSSPVGPFSRPGLPSATSAGGCPLWFACFAGTTPLYAPRVLPPARLLLAGGDEVSRFSRVKFSVPASRKLTPQFVDYTRTRESEFPAFDDGPAVHAEACPTRLSTAFAITVTYLRRHPNRSLAVMARHGVSFPSRDRQGAVTLNTSWNFRNGYLANFGLRL
jgi:hypothetical protein